MVREEYQVVSTSKYNHQGLFNVFYNGYTLAEWIAKQINDGDIIKFEVCIFARNICVCGHNKDLHNTGEIAYCYHSYMCGCSEYRD